MKITGIGWQGYVLPFRQKYITSVGQVDRRFGLLLFLQTDVGLVGMGEASPVGTGTLEKVREIAAIFEEVIPRLLDSDFDILEETMSGWEKSAPLCFGIETAVLDIRGQAEGLPLTVLLGGSPALLSVDTLISAESAGQAAISAREVVKLGFTSLKLKVGIETLDQDEALLAAVRGAVGYGVRIRLDANQAWDVDRAIESIRRLSKYELEFVEQPVPACNIDGMAEVRRAVSVPLAADESLGSLADLHRILKAGAADVLVIKAARLGGIKLSLGMAREAIAAGHVVVVTTALESGVGIAASAHLAGALPDQPYSHGLATGLLFDHDMAIPHLALSGSRLMIPGGSGLGVKVDAALLRKYRIPVMGSAGSFSGFREYLSL